MQQQQIFTAAPPIWSEYKCAACLESDVPYNTMSKNCFWRACGSITFQLHEIDSCECIASEVMNMFGIKRVLTDRYPFSEWLGKTFIKTLYISEMLSHFFFFLFPSLWQDAPKKRVRIKASDEFNMLFSIYSALKGYLFPKRPIGERHKRVKGRISKREITRQRLTKPETLRSVGKQKSPRLCLSIELQPILYSAFKKHIDSCVAIKALGQCYRLLLCRPPLPITSIKHLRVLWCTLEEA